MPGVSVDIDTVETNILYFEVDTTVGSANAVCKRLQERGVWMLPVAPQRIRAVTHLDVLAEDIERAIVLIRRALSDTG